jgi:hypothetical protein
MWISDALTFFIKKIVRFGRFLGATASPSEGMFHLKEEHW